MYAHMIVLSLLSFSFGLGPSPWKSAAHTEGGLPTSINPIKKISNQLIHRLT